MKKIKAIKIKAIMKKFEVGKVYRSCDGDDDYLYRYEGLCKDIDGNEAYQFGVITNDKYREPVYGVCLRTSHMINVADGPYVAECVFSLNNAGISAANIVED